MGEYDILRLILDCMGFYTLHYKSSDDGDVETESFYVALDVLELNL